MKTTILTFLTAAFGLAGSALAATSCPSNAVDLDLKDGAGLTCSCPAPVAEASIYGTDRYTADSDICAAAVHAGKATANGGGEVTVYTGPGCPVFKGTARNGVSSTPWDSYDKTFAFASPLPACEVAASDATPATPSSPAPAPAAGTGDSAYDRAIECAAATSYVTGMLRSTPGADQAKITAYDNANSAWVMKLSDFDAQHDMNKRIDDIQAKQQIWANDDDGMSKAQPIADDCVAHAPVAQ